MGRGLRRPHRMGGAIGARARRGVCAAAGRTGGRRGLELGSGTHFRIDLLVPSPVVPHGVYSNLRMHTCTRVAQGKLTVTGSAPAWHPAVQPSGVAKWTAVCGITRLLRQPTPVFADYASLVSAAKSPRRTPTATAALRHGGLQRFFEHNPKPTFRHRVAQGQGPRRPSSVANDETRCGTPSATPSPTLPPNPPPRGTLNGTLRTTAALHRHRPRRHHPPRC